MTQRRPRRREMVAPPRRCIKHRLMLAAV
jgi:hypothetical protein